MSFILCLTILIPTIAYISRIYIRNIIKSWSLPGPLALPYIGNALQLSTKSPVALLLYICEKLTKHEGFVRVWLGPDLLCITSNPTDCEVCKTEIKKTPKDVNCINVSDKYFLNFASSGFDIYSYYVHIKYMYKTRFVNSSFLDFTSFLSTSSLDAIHI